MKRTMLALAGLAALLVAPSVDAQEPEMGSRVRITAAPDTQLRDAEGRDIAAGPVTGHLVRVGEGTLTLLLEGRSTTVTLPAVAVKRLEVSTGRRSRGRGALRGSGVGLLLGGLTGAAIGFLSGDDHCTSDPNQWGFNCLFTMRKEEKAALGAIGLGTLGAAGGALAGALVPGETWRRAAEIPQTKEVRVGVVPIPGRGVAGTLSIRF